MDNEKGWIALFWSMIGLGILAVIFNSGKVESDLTGRVNAALHNNGYEWASVKEGSGRNLVLVGRAPVTAAREPALEAARDVYGVRSIDDEITISDPVSPYAWSAKVDIAHITLNGHVPDADMRAVINQKAAEIAVDRKIKDNMTLADGAPDQGWMENVAFALDQTRNIKSGAVHIVDQSVRIEGTAWNSADAKAASSVSQAVAGYTLSSSIKSPAMLAAESAPSDDAAAKAAAKQADSPAPAAKVTAAADDAGREKAAPAAAKPDAAGKTAPVMKSAKTESPGGKGDKKEDVTDTVSAKTGDDNAPSSGAESGNKPGFFSKALSAIKSMGGKDDDKTGAEDASGGQAAHVNAGAKGDAGKPAGSDAIANAGTKTDAGTQVAAAPAPGQAAQSDGTENGAKSPDTKQKAADNGGSAAAANGGSATPAASDSAAASAAPAADSGAGTPGGDLAGAKAAKPAAASAAKPAAGAGTQAAMAAAKPTVTTPRPARGARPGAYPVPRAMIGPAWAGQPWPGPPYIAGPPWHGGPFGPVGYPYPPCPWGPAYCPPVW